MAYPSKHIWADGGLRLRPRWQRILRSPALYLQYRRHLSVRSSLATTIAMVLWHPRDVDAS